MADKDNDKTQAQVSGNMPGNHAVEAHSTPGKMRMIAPARMTRAAIPTALSALSWIGDCRQGVLASWPPCTRRLDLGLFGCFSRSCGPYLPRIFAPQS
jgi:hypothetical protein